jgi:hypothetical protein
MVLLSFFVRDLRLRNTQEILVESTFNLIWKLMSNFQSLSSRSGIGGE